MKKILVTGSHGQVGWELARTLSPLGRVIAVSRAEMDLSDAGSIRKKVREIAPDIIVNAAAYTAVDRAEGEEALAHAVNAIAPGILAEEALRLGSAIVHYSTDYVFDGTKTGPYEENEATCPLSAYGRTKLAGEEAVRNSGAAHLVFRTSWVYGVRGHNFLRTMLRLAKERDELRIVSDQIGAPTWSRMIAEATSLVLAKCPDIDAIREKSGIYHLSSSGSTSWFGFASVILKDADIALHPIPSEAYPLPAARPKNSLLSGEKLESVFGIRLPDWESSLALCRGDLGESC
ncbi:MAG: dTDP-4-dehydrorhamnose reductase [Burkholderiales bacterium]|nr:dTDP-4-dehydrorhamnose reductase [Burkholderiales bacterium]